MITLRFLASLLFTLCFTFSYSQDLHLIRAKKIAQHLKVNETDSVFNYFEESLQKKISAEQLKTVWLQIQAQAGILLTMEEPVKDKDLAQTLYSVEMSFDKMALQLRLPFDTAGKLVGFFIAPGKSKIKYEAPDYDTKNYTEKELFIESGKYKLKAMLTLPNSIKNPPVVILVHGSGPHDFDESIDPNKPFKDIAIGFAKNGIATLRYNKRTLSYANEFASNTLYTPNDEVNDDAVAAVDLCKKLNETQQSKVFLLGHSLGGMLAPHIASKTNYLNGIILMGANARPLEDVYYEQVAFILGQDSLSPDEQRKLMDIRKQCDKVKQIVNEKTNSSELPLQLAPSYWNWLRTYKQTDVAAKLTIPTLVLQANNDYQVSLKEFELWKKALINNKNAAFISYPGLFHLFMDGVGIPADYEQKGHVKELVITDMANWIKEICK